MKAAKNQAKDVVAKEERKEVVKDAVAATDVAAENLEEKELKTEDQEKNNY